MKKAIKIFVKITSVILYPFYLAINKVVLRGISFYRSQWFRLDLKLNGAIVGDNLVIGKDVIFRIGKNSKVSIGNNVVIGDDVYINVKKGAELRIGNNVHINKGSRVSSFKSINIGSNTLVASYCNVLDHNHVYDLKSPASTILYESSPIFIGDGVWLGTKVQVNKGINIGEFSVIGANSVVTKNVESSSVYGGIPAKKIR